VDPDSRLLSSSSSFRRTARPVPVIPGPNTWTPSLARATSMSNPAELWVDTSGHTSSVGNQFGREQRARAGQDQSRRVCAQKLSGQARRSWSRTTTGSRTAATRRHHAYASSRRPSARSRCSARNEPLLQAPGRLRVAELRPVLRRRALDRGGATDDRPRLGDPTELAHSPPPGLCGTQRREVGARGRLKVPLAVLPESGHSNGSTSVSSQRSGNPAHCAEGAGEECDSLPSAWAEPVGVSG